MFRRAPSQHQQSGRDRPATPWMLRDEQSMIFILIGMASDYENTLGIVFFVIDLSFLVGAIEILNRLSYPAGVTRGLRA